MRVDKINSDYQLYFSIEELLKVTTPINTLGGFKYSSISSQIPNSIQILDFSCTNHSFVMHDPKSRDGIFFDFDEIGPLVRIHTRGMLNLLNQKVDYIMTRYDGENKIWIYRDE